LQVKKVNDIDDVDMFILKFLNTIHTCRDGGSRDSNDNNKKTHDQMLSIAQVVVEGVTNISSKTP